MTPKTPVILQSRHLNVVRQCFQICTLLPPLTAEDRKERILIVLLIKTCMSLIMI